MLGYLKRKVQEANQAATEKKAELDAQQGDRISQQLGKMETALKNSATTARERAAERAEVVRGGGMQGVKDAYAEKRSQDVTRHNLALARVDYIHQDDNRIKGTIKGLQAQAAMALKCRRDRTREWDAMTDEQRQEWIR